MAGNSLGDACMLCSKGLKVCLCFNASCSCFWLTSNFPDLIGTVVLSGRGWKTCYYWCACNYGYCHDQAFFAFFPPWQDDRGRWTSPADRAGIGIHKSLAQLNRAVLVQQGLRLVYCSAAYFCTSIQYTYSYLTYKLQPYRYIILHVCVMSLYTFHSLYIRTVIIVCISYVCVGKEHTLASGDCW